MDEPPLILKIRNNCTIPDQYKFHENGGIFLLLDSGEDDTDRLLVFGTEADLDDMKNHKDWACDATFKCSPEMYCQLYTLNTVIRNNCIPCLSALLPGKSELTYSRSSYYNLRPRCRCLKINATYSAINILNSIEIRFIILFES